jgi:hypothetical protein
MVRPCICTRREPTGVSKALVTRGKEVGAREGLFHYQQKNLSYPRGLFSAIIPGRFVSRFWNCAYSPRRNRGHEPGNMGLAKPGGGATVRNGSGTRDKFERYNDDATNT